jgi:hypothetical protein
VCGRERERERENKKVLKTILRMSVVPNNSLITFLINSRPREWNPESDPSP